MLWDVPAVKLLVRHAGTAHDAFRAAVEAAVGDAAIATWTVPGLVEISAPGVTKAAALAATEAPDVRTRVGAEGLDQRLGRAGRELSHGGRD